MEETRLRKVKKQKIIPGYLSDILKLLIDIDIQYTLCIRVVFNFIWSCWNAFTKMFPVTLQNWTSWNGLAQWGSG